MVVFFVLTINTAFVIATDTSTKISEIKTKDYYDYYYSDINNKKIALTFDDGPSPETTIKIARILKKHNIPATFFFTGSNTLKHKDIVEAISKAGFEIGNHSFTHSPKVHNTENRLKWELNITNQLIERITNQPVLLYRPPFLLDMENNKVLTWVTQNGYIPVGADIDPQDFLARSPQELLVNLKNKLTNGHIVLLHDNKNITVESLEAIISYIKAEGYQFTTVSQLLGINLEKNLAINTHSLQQQLNIIYFSFISLVWPSTSTFLKIGLILVGFRLFFIFFLFLLHKKQSWQKKRNQSSWHRHSSVSVVIPAYNEEENIEATIYSILRNNYLIDEILVINDGSTDNTVEKVYSLQKKYPQIKLLSIRNSGKANALNIGIKMTKSEIIVALDGDTIFHKNTILNLVRHFDDKDVEAVAGKIYAIQSSGIISAFQNIEYIVSQNIVKKAFYAINAVDVVPGAVGAWRKSAVLRFGGFNSDTLVEDKDLTLAILKSGKKVVYEPEAISYTETPHTIKNFAKQRFRWIFGTIQCFWKYKSSLFSFRRPNLGWVILPNIIIYDMLIPLLSPFIDIIIIFSLFFGSWTKAVLACLLFTIFDLIYTGIALGNEKIPRRLFLIILLQRLLYRQVIYFVVAKSVIKAIEGTYASWTKVKKTGQTQKYYIGKVLSHNI